MSKLTKSIVDRAEPRTKQFTIWDSELKGFGVYVQPSGSRTYFVDYRTGDGRRRRMTIGRHGAITTEQARKLAIETMGGVVLQKSDPLLEKRTRRASLTVAELCDAYVLAAEKGLIIGRSGRPKKVSTLATDKGRIERHIKPLLGAKLVLDLKPSDIAKFIRDVTAGKTAIVEKSEKLRGKSVVQGGAGTASRTAGLFGGILSYAASEGIIDKNPVHGVKRPNDNKRHRRLTAGEFRAFAKVLNEGAEPWQSVACIKLLAFTGCRRGEVVSLKWSEVDIKGRALHLSDTKTGQSVRPLANPALDVLNGIERKPGAVYVLTGVRDETQHYAGLAGAMDRIMKAANLRGVTAHTLRHSFASVGADLGFSDSTIGACLGHSATGITSRYTHRLDSVLVAAADKIACEIKMQMGG